MSEPGWYADPLGPPGSYRWWDGTSWTEQVTSAPPSAPEQVPPAAPDYPAQPASPGYLGQPAAPGYPGQPAAPARRNRTPLLIAALTAVVLLAGAVGFLATRGDDPEVVAGNGDEETTTTGGEDEETTTTDEEDEDEPDNDALSIGTASYEPLGGDWEVIEGINQDELPGAVGQSQVAQPDVPPPIDGDWIANIVLGNLDPTIPYSGPADLQTATETLVDKIINQSGAYPAGTTSDVVSAEAQEVDGNEAFVIRAELQYAVHGLDATGETVLIAVIDTGQLPAAFWGSIPNNVPDLVADMDEAFASISVED